jgi:hypothetical protein
MNGEAESKPLLHKPSTGAELSGCWRVGAQVSGRRPARDKELSCTVVIGQVGLAWRPCLPRLGPLQIRWPSTAIGCRSMAKAFDGQGQGPLTTALPFRQHPS